jgi:hypothetical protein
LCPDAPLPHCSNLKAWEEIRIHYLKKLYTDWEDVNFIGLDCDLLNNADKMKGHHSIFIWAGTGLEDQLLILFVVYLADITGADASKIKLVQFESYPNKKFLVRSMGELSPENICRYPTPTSLIPSDIDNFRTAWLAVTSSNPIALQAYVSTGEPAFPYLLRAMRHLLRRYPERRSGLLFWDWKLLQNSRKNGPIAVRIIGNTMGVDDGDTVHDNYLFYRLRELANKRNPKPLIELHGTQNSLRDQL